MPVVKKNMNFTVSKGSRSVVAKIKRTSNIDKDVKLAFSEAYDKFVTEFGRHPNFDYVRFLGGTTTLDVIFEICEDVIEE